MHEINDSSGIRALVLLLTDGLACEEGNVTKLRADQYRGAVEVEPGQIVTAQYEIEAPADLDIYVVTDVDGIGRDVVLHEGNPSASPAAIIRYKGTIDRIWTRATLPHKTIKHARMVVKGLTPDTHLPYLQGPTMYADKAPGSLNVSIYASLPGHERMSFKGRNFSKEGSHNVQYWAAAKDMKRPPDVFVGFTDAKPGRAKGKEAARMFTRHVPSPAWMSFSYLLRQAETLEGVKFETPRLSLEDETPEDYEDDDLDVEPSTLIIESD